MITVILVIHLLIAIALVGVILLQRSEGGALGMGGGGGGLMSGRAAGNFLTRTTAILAAAFFTTSMVLAILANNQSGSGASVLDKAAETPSKTEAPASSGQQPTSQEPAAPVAQ